MLLSDYRKQAGYKTQAEFAKSISATRDVVVKWETGVSYPRAPEIPRIAKMLHISSEDLIAAITRAKEETA